MFQFIKDNLQYPPEAVKKGVQGNVYVGFVVTEDGSIENVRIKN